MKQDAMQSDILALMKLAAGRRVVWRLLEQAGVWRSVFNPEPVRMAFAEGRRNLGLWLLDWVMRECPDEYDLMMREARDER
ncbi:hypothetical protein A7Q01_00095 [Eikenella sp. NML96-A-049]|uniref:Bbp19 family protein n=1 Tax=Eikenella sp. NML96-A-049 TaxID=1809061 RepID=UPI0007E026E1|nr:hypothetical protein [Eikenella sp. NML96-A-049]OAM43494.1 hypothetical protein A7Q01_00095 [Eikenella sp. NML96-A-049]